MVVTVSKFRGCNTVPELKCLLVMSTVLVGCKVKAQGIHRSRRKISFLVQKKVRGVLPNGPEGPNKKRGLRLYLKGG